MEQYIASYIQGLIAAQHYADLVAGLVIPRRIKRETQRLLFPSAYAPSVTGAGSCEGEWLDIVPDDSRKSIFFFEPVRGATAVKHEGRFVYFTATIRLVGWLNLKKLGLTPEAGTSCGWGFRVMQNIMSLIPDTFISLPACHMNAVEILIGDTAPRGRGIWEGYTVDREKVDFLNPAHFDYFAVELDCKWRMATSCFSVIPENPPTC